MINPNSKIFPLVSSVTLYQYAICNWRIMKLRLLMENEQLTFKIIDQDWTGETSEEEEQVLRESFESTEFCLCFPSWYGKTAHNLSLVEMLKEENKFLDKPIYIYECNPEPYLISTPNQQQIQQQQLTKESLEEIRQQELRNKLIAENRLITKFSALFLDVSNLEPDQEWSSWLPGDGRAIVLDVLKHSILLNLINYALISELQSLLKTNNYYGGLIDGDYGQRTQLAVRRFLKLQHLDTNNLSNLAIYQLLKTDAVKRDRVKN